MARRFGFRAVLGGLWLAMAGAAAGQAMVETGLSAARAATATAPAAGLGKSIQGLAGGLDKALQAEQPGSEAAPSPGAAAPAAKPPSPGEAKPAEAAKWEDPGAITAGLSYTELLRRFGPPSLEITGETGRTLTYSAKGGAFHVRVEDDRVASVRKPKS